MFIALCLELSTNFDCSNIIFECEECPGFQTYSSNVVSLFYARLSTVLKRKNVFGGIIFYAESSLFATEKKEVKKVNDLSSE